MAGDIVGARPNRDAAIAKPLSGQRLSQRGKGSEEVDLKGDR
jgi:hypothetical protein